MLKLKRQLVSLLTTVLLLLTAGMVQAQEQCKMWNDWEKYAERFIQTDGRVVEFSAGSRTTSEGQAYALFFALVANDRDRFEKVLDWTKANLADNQLDKQLPAWLWGKKDEEDWGVIDSNSASDADLWIAYTLLEAARLWDVYQYKSLGDSLLTLIKKKEVVKLDAYSALLLPGEIGFDLPDESWRLNPSYAPAFLIQYLSRYDPTGPWKAIQNTTIEMLNKTSPHGLVADWVSYRTDLGFGGDTAKGTVGSFDSIRVYLWMGMTHEADKVRQQTLFAIDGMYKKVSKTWIPPMYVDVLTGSEYGAATPGFYAALLPYLSLMGDRSIRPAFADRVVHSLSDNKLSEPLKYYDFNLSLFGLGHYFKRFTFDSTGKLCTGWDSSCKTDLYCQ